MDDFYDFLCKVLEILAGVFAAYLVILPLILFNVIENPMIPGFEVIAYIGLILWILFVSCFMGIIGIDYLSKGSPILGLSQMVFAFLILGGGFIMVFFLIHS